jgi:caa(3)-type oxidase subunit IV
MTEAASSSNNENAFYTIIWAWLVILLALGLAIFVLDLPRNVAAALIFLLAAIKATMVMRYYMNLRQEPSLVYLIMLVPALFAAALAFCLVPDIVWHHHLNG